MLGLPDAGTLIPEVIVSTAAIAPRSGLWGAMSPGMAAGGGGAASPSEKVGIGQYARLFEDAFRNFDGAGGALKVAQRTGISATTGVSATDSLWFVRFAGQPESPAVNGIQAAFTGDLARQY